VVSKRLRMIGFGGLRSMTDGKDSNAVADQPCLKSGKKLHP
jgi:hypothetical protein